MIILSMCIKVCHLVILYLANFYTRMLFAKKSPQNPQPCKLSLFCQIGFEARNIVRVDGSHEKDERSSRQCFQKAFCEDTSLLSDHLGEARTKFVGGLNLTSREG